MADLALYTDSFPYNNSETFLETEIPYLCKAFETITIFPLKGNGRLRPVPSNVKVTEPFLGKENSRLIQYLTGFLNMRLLFTEPALRKNLPNISFIKALKYVGYGILIKKRLQKCDPGQFHLHYSYWLNYWSVALAFAKKGNDISCFIARGHRYDLYKGQGENALDYLKDFVIEHIDKLYLISNHGLSYINNLYPEQSNKFFLSRLGTPSHQYSNPVNISEELVLVSCSGARPVKRLHLILNALIIISRKHPLLKMKWVHIGDGEMLEDIRLMSNEKLSGTNIKCLINGRLSNQEVFELYKIQPFDLFINVSENEGIPVSVMEAQSFGIPILATSTGGVPEIVNDENGQLLNVGISASELADILYNISSNIDNWRIKREYARKNWLSKFNAENNYYEFAGSLKNMVKI